MLSSIPAEHTKIAEFAATQANKDQWVQETFGGPVLTIASQDVSQRAIRLRWDFELHKTGDPEKDDEMIRKMNEIVKKAIYDAILEYRESFVGVIVGTAKKGKNYFEMFE